MKDYLKENLDLAKIIDVFDELPLWSAPFGLKLLEFVDYKPNITALDIGFGTGFPLTEIAMRLGEGSTVFGIDPWRDAIDRVNKKIEYYHLKNIKVIEGEAESIPLEDESVDLIVSNNGINNVTDIDLVLSECSRIIKPGGQFIFTMNLDTTMFEFYDELEKVLSEFKLEKEIEKMHKHIYLKRRPLEEMISMIKNHGFIIKEMEHDQFNYRFADGTTMFNHYFIRLAFLDSWKKLVPKIQVEKIFDIIETRLNEQAIDLGGLKLSVPFVLFSVCKKMPLGSL